MDDADREGERLAVREWLEVFGERLEVRYCHLTRLAFLIEVPAI